MDYQDLLYIDSATGAMSIFCNAITATVPLGADPLYRRLGYGWGYTLLASLTLPFMGITVVLLRYSERIRKLDSAFRLTAVGERRSAAILAGLIMDGTLFFESMTFVLISTAGCLMELNQDH